jgi:hypothetical protein
MNRWLYSLILICFFVSGIFFGHFDLSNFKNIRNKFFEMIHIKTNSTNLFDGYVVVLCAFDIAYEYGEKAFKRCRAHGRKIPKEICSRIQDIVEDYVETIVHCQLLLLEPLSIPNEKFVRIRD